MVHYRCRGNQPPHYLCRRNQLLILSNAFLLDSCVRDANKLVYVCKISLARPIFFVRN